MRPHPYLRAYMAGIVVPTLFLLVTMTFDAFHRYYFEVPNQFVLGLPARPLDPGVRLGRSCSQKPRGGSARGEPERLTSPHASLPRPVPVAA